MNAIHPSRISVADRPYLIRFDYPGGGTYPLAAEEVRNLLANYPLVSFRPGLLRLRGEAGKTSIYPATLGGGEAFSLAAETGETL